MKQYIWIVASAFFAITIVLELYKDIAKRPQGMQQKGAVAYFTAVQSGLFFAITSFVINILLCCFTKGHVFAKILYIGGSAVCMFSSWIHGGLWKSACRKADKKNKIAKKRDTIDLYATTVQKDLDYLRLQLCEVLDWDTDTDVEQLQRMLAETNLRTDEICRAEETRLAEYHNERKLQKRVAVAKTLVPTASLVLCVAAIVAVCI